MLGQVACAVPLDELLEELLEEELLDELLEELLDDELPDDELLLAPVPPQPTMEVDKSAIATVRRVFCIINPP